MITVIDLNPFWGQTHVPKNPFSETLQRMVSFKSYNMGLFILMVVGQGIRREHQFTSCSIKELHGKCWRAIVSARHMDRAYQDQSKYTQDTALAAPNQ